MSPLERWSLHLAALATAGTGLLDGLLRWFGARQGEFGPEPHPWLGTAQHLHILVAPALVFCLGLIVRGHLSAKLKTGAQEGRRTGLGVGLLILPMVLSGYLVQVATAEVWRVAFAWAHGTSSLLFLAGYLGHALKTWFTRKATAASALGYTRIPLKEPS
jgi:hypothetical protein